MAKGYESKIHRTTRRKNFLIIGNETCQCEMSYEALGLLVRILSRPDDWKIIKKELEKPNCKRTKLARIFRELAALGYVVPREVRIKGRFAGIDYDVFDEPQPQAGFPAAEEPAAEEPAAGNQPLQSTESLQSTFLKEQSIKTTTKAAVVVPEKIRKILRDSSEQLIAQYGISRVSMVCEAAARKKSPAGFAKTALRDGWVLAEDEEKIRNSSDEDPERFVKGEFADHINR